jgi:hypothetical protein
VWSHPMANVGGSIRLIVARSRSCKQSLKLASKSYCSTFNAIICTMVHLHVPFLWMPHWGY